MTSYARMVAELIDHTTLLFSENPLLCSIIYCEQQLGSCRKLEMRLQIMSLLHSSWVPSLIEIGSRLSLTQRESHSYFRECCSVSQLFGNREQAGMLHYLVAFQCLHRGSVKNVMYD